MADVNKATVVNRAKRGYRRVTLTLPVAMYAALEKMGAAEERTPDQQALYMLKRIITMPYQIGTEDEGRDRDNGEMDVEREEIVVE